MPSSALSPPGLLFSEVTTTNSGGLARRSRPLGGTGQSMLLHRLNSAPEPNILDPPNKLIIGVCAMDKKARSKPMREILQRMTSFNEFEVVVFGDATILNEPAADWPRCDCLLSWYSEGFPLAKAQEYVALRHPFCVNDLGWQSTLLDRRMVYKTLKENGVPVPKHITVSREEGDVAGPPGFIEDHDWVEMDGVRINKPFVEKPCSGEDHNIWVYYPSSMGGGVKRLFRKVDDKSADYDATHPGTVRRDGSYIYEVFLATCGTDVKVYTVGPRYAHAEARKSPVVDGRVNRAADGKEERYPVLLSPQEKEIARMVTLACYQKVCGFDLLRAENGRSYVCDVNGWSFVKNSVKYYDDAAGILRSIVLDALSPQRMMLMPRLPAPIPSLREEEGEGEDADSHGMRGNMSMCDLNDADVNEDLNEELRCVCAVVRHGDRTPKQKIKMVVRMPPLLALFDKHRNSKGDQAKLKNPLQMQELLSVVRRVLVIIDKAAASPLGLAGLEPQDAADLGTFKDMEAAEELKEQLNIVKTVLEQEGGHFSGVNRKAQIKPTRTRSPAAPVEGQAMTPAAPSLEEAVLVVKWGGVLTHAGRNQAEQLGMSYRASMYPRQGPAGGGLLRLHSTYRHDLKIYSSDEGRVQVSAAAFAKGLLDLEGNSLTPILVSLVNKDATMLEAFGKGASDEIQSCKDVIQAQLAYDPMKGPPPLTPSRPCQITLRQTNSSPPVSPSYPAHTIHASAHEAGSSGPSPTLQATNHSTATVLVAMNSYTESPKPTVMQPTASWPALKQASEVADTNTVGPDLMALSSETSERPGAADADSQLERLMHMPDHPLELLNTLRVSIRRLVDQLEKKCSVAGDAASTGANAYNCQNQAPEDIQLSEGQPCGGERLVLLYERWKKLLHSFYSDKKISKRTYDISKVPDIYDSVKHDAIHNAHLGLEDLPEIYTAAKQLADVVIPHEYGLEPHSKLSIGYKIAKELVGKLLCDMASMQMESENTAGTDLGPSVLNGSADDLPPSFHDTMATEFACLSDDRLRSKTGHLSVVRASSDDGSSTVNGSSAEMHGGEEDLEDGVRHRLCPTYASDVNSPMRHVRTRIYCTSESHIHSLLNVLRFCHLRADYQGPHAVNGDAQELLDSIPELDYLTQVVFRMYENMTVPVGDPKRFRVEVLFSPGAAHNPLTQTHKDHTLPVVPLVQLNLGTAETLAELGELLAPFSVARKINPDPYALSVALKAPGLSISRKTSTHCASQASLSSTDQNAGSSGVDNSSTLVHGRTSSNNVGMHEQTGSHMPQGHGMSRMSRMASAPLSN